MKNLKLKDRLFNLGKAILNSAPFALLLSIVFFWWERVDNDRDLEMTLSNFSAIEQSLSTRYIGIFPDYLDQINTQILSDENASEVIIFEDVLFYGAFYNPNAFTEMVRKLTAFAQHDSVYIAFYDNNPKFRLGRMFNEVVKESWMRQDDLPLLAAEINQAFEQHRKEAMERRNHRAKGALAAKPDSAEIANRLAEEVANITNIDFELCEKYFRQYTKAYPKEYSARIKNLLKPFYNEKFEGDDVNGCAQLFKELDSIKLGYLQKPIDEITYRDIYNTYNEATNLLKDFYRQHGVHLIPLHNYLSMSCWSNGKFVLFALPGRFAADEIGFVSQDKTIINYVRMMLSGVSNDYRTSDNIYSKIEENN